MGKKKAVKTTSNKAQRRRVTLSISAPHAEAVFLVGDFNQWNEKMHPMRQEADGVWKKSILVQPGRYEYRFLVDDQWQNDPSNDHLCPNCFGTENNILDVLK